MIASWDHWTDEIEDEVLWPSISVNTVRTTPGRYLYREGEPAAGIYWIGSGLMGEKKTAPWGSSQFVRIAKRGDILGWRSFCTGEAHRSSAIALQHSELGFIDRATLSDQLQTNPIVGMRLLSHAALEFDGTADHLLTLQSRRNGRARLARFLLILVNAKLAESHGGSLRVHLPLSRIDLAGFIGIRPETLSRVIKNLEQDDVAHFSAREVYVPAVARLSDEIL